MIISASYKTDIPTFYGEWFMNRIRAGYCLMQNPYSRQTKRVSLLPQDVQGIVFWTKNIGPMIKHLPELRDRGYPFYIQHTLNNYPAELEEKVIANKDMLAYYFAHIVKEYGPEVMIWRYDPILITSLTPENWHIRNVQGIARLLEGCTNEMVFSYEQTYEKTRRNTNLAASKGRFTWTPSEDIPLAQKQELATTLAELASSYGMHVKACTQPEYLRQDQLITEARCADLERLERVAEHNLAPIQQKGMRKDCRCFQNVDIGEYDTCPHGCVYCYATKDRLIALNRFKAHDPQGEYLFPPQ